MTSDVLKRPLVRLGFAAAALPVLYVGYAVLLFAGDCAFDWSSEEAFANFFGRNVKNIVLPILASLAVWTCTPPPRFWPWHLLAIWPFALIWGSIAFLILEAWTGPHY